jgi:hypothetical protein
VGGTGGTDQCFDGLCAAFPCTEQGIRDAIAEGGGPHFFACNGPTTVVTEAEIVIDNDVILDGEGNLTVHGNGNHRVFSVAQGITAELRGFGVSNGRAATTESGSHGGGIRNLGMLTLAHSTVWGNSAEYGTGGGLYNEGMLTLMNSTVSHNRAGSAEGGGIFNEGGTLTLINSTVSGNSVGGPGPTVYYGGGIYNEGTLALTNSTVSGNGASEGAGLYNETLGTLINSTVSGNSAYSSGGGILNAGTLTLTNSTVSGNTAYTGFHASRGGGIANTGQLSLTHSTVSGNAADDGSGISNFGTLTLTNTLVEHGGCVGTAVSGGGNLESPGDTCGLDQSSDQVNVSSKDLGLGLLADNGGPTMTHALGTGSVAIDWIPEAECVDVEGQPVTTDQRGVTRPQGPACDVGAFELEQ